jgi:hypothetical protein
MGQDGASAPTTHLNSPRPYARGIAHPRGGGTIKSHVSFPLRKSTSHAFMLPIECCISGKTDSLKLYIQV